MRPRIWPVFVAYLVAVMTIILSSLVALGVLQAAYPDVPPADLFGSATGLIAGALASATALVLTVMLVSQPLQAKTLGLLPGREQGLDLAAAVVATLALGQALDSVTILAGREGAMRDIRRALAGAEGAELFAAVLVLGVAAAAAEELFFRGYMQTRLRAAWPPGAAIVATSAAFGLLHMDWVHAAMAFVLGLYFGALTERTGSALPAIVCHVVNNSVFTVVTALGGTIEGRRPNLWLLVLSLVVCASCIGLLARRLPRAVPAAPDC